MEKALRDAADVMLAFGDELFSDDPDLRIDDPAPRPHVEPGATRPRHRDEH
jgi:hypothetical protein